MKKKRLPIGISDFYRIINENYYYVDKSLLIQELLDDGSLITLITRPRRFGKTLNLMMLKYWFERYEDLGVRDQGLGSSGQPGLRYASSVEATQPPNDTQHLTPNTQHPTPNTQHPTPNTQHPTPNTQCQPIQTPKDLAIRRRIHPTLWKVSCNIFILKGCQSRELEKML